MRHRATTLLAITIGLAAAYASRAATLVLHASPVDEIESRFDASRGRGEDRQRLAIDLAVPLPDVVDRIELLGEAPAGFAWAVDPFEPSLLLATTLRLVAFNATVLAPTAEIRAVRWILEGPEGALLELADVGNGTRIATDPPGGLDLLALYELADALAFTAFRLEIESEPVIVTEAGIAPFEEASLWFEYSAPEDPGPRLSLVPVPAPAGPASGLTAALVLRWLVRSRRENKRLPGLTTREQLERIRAGGGMIAARQPGLELRRRTLARELRAGTLRPLRRGPARAVARRLRLRRGGPHGKQHDRLRRVRAARRRDGTAS